MPFASKRLIVGDDPIVSLAAARTFSPAWVSSAVRADELAQAVRQGKRLVPVLCRDAAVRQRIAVQARQLAAESLRLMLNVEADQVLRRALARLALRQAELPHAGIVDTDAVDSDGAFMAFVDVDRVLHVVDSGRMVETFRFDAGGRARHAHVDRAVFAFASREDLLASSTRGDPITVWDLDKSAVVTRMSQGGEITQLGRVPGIAPLNESFRGVRSRSSVQFSPDGRHLLMHGFDRVTSSQTPVRSCRCRCCCWRVTRPASWAPTPRAC